ncbi:MAG: hypothetical protein D6812_12190 [Deltaproteobacteria bacterium]|nr:MAG: hypothetical protein D6812_12190 [Deltaproteobacteria bacterium]
MAVRKKKPVPTHVARKRLLKASGGKAPKGATTRLKDNISDAALAAGRNIGIAAPGAKKRRDKRIDDAIYINKKKPARKKPRRKK